MMSPVALSTPPSGSTVIAHCVGDPLTSTTLRTSLPSALSSKRTACAPLTIDSHSSYALPGPGSATRRRRRRPALARRPDDLERSCTGAGERCRTGVGLFEDLRGLAGEVVATAVGVAADDEGAERDQDQRGRDRRRAPFAAGTGDGWPGRRRSPAAAVRVAACCRSRPSRWPSARRGDRWQRTPPLATASPGTRRPRAAHRARRVVGLELGALAFIDCVERVGRGKLMMSMPLTWQLLVRLAVESFRREFSS